MMTDREPNHVGQLIRSELEKQNMSQKALGDKLGVSQVAISHFIYDQLPLYQSVPIAAALGIPLEWIFDAMAKDYRKYLTEWSKSKRELSLDFGKKKKTKNKTDELSF